MVFYQLDDGYHAELRVVQAGTAAFGLYARCGLWMADNVADNVEDGVVPLEIATLYGTREWIEKLLVTGLWQAVTNGFLDVDYLARHKNRTKAKVLAERAKKAERDRRYIEAKARNRASGAPARRVERRVEQPSNDTSNDTAHDDAPPPPTPNGVGVVSPVGPASAWPAAFGDRTPASAGSQAPAGPTGDTTQSETPAQAAERIQALRDELAAGRQAWEHGPHGRR